MQKTPKKPGHDDDNDDDEVISHPESWNMTPQQVEIEAWFEEVEIKAIGLPLLQHVLRCLDLLRRSGDGDYSISRSRKGFVDLNERIRLRADSADATAALSDDCASKLLDEKESERCHVDF